MCENLVQVALIKLCKKKMFRKFHSSELWQRNDFDREREESAINLFRFIFKLHRNLCVACLLVIFFFGEQRRCNCWESFCLHKVKYEEALRCVQCKIMQKKRGTTSFFLLSFLLSCQFEHVLTIFEVEISVLVHVSCLSMGRCNIVRFWKSFFFDFQLKMWCITFVIDSECANSNKRS